MPRDNRRLFWLGGAAAALSAALALAASGQEPPGDHQSLNWRPGADGRPQPLRSIADWQQRRADIVVNVETVMGPCPRPASPTPLEPRVVDEVAAGNIVLRKVVYHTDSRDTTVGAWLLIPPDAPGAKRPRAAVLCLHQTVDRGKDEPAGLAGKESLHYARHLAERGFITLAPDYPSLGEYQHDFSADAYESGSMKAIYDNIRAIDYLASLPEVDRSRIGAIGHSLGGHNAIFTALFEPRIKAVVSCCGFTSFHRYYGGDLKGWAGPRYMPRIAEQYDCDPDRVPFDFAELVAAIAPRALLAVAPLNDDNFDVSGVRDVIAAAQPIFEMHGAGERLRAVYPHAGHDFPAEAREAAYEFLAQQLDAVRQEP